MVVYDGGWTPRGGGGNFRGRGSRRGTGGERAFNFSSGGPAETRNIHISTWVDNILGAVINRDGYYFAELLKLQIHHIPPHDLRFTPENVLNAVVHSRMKIHGSGKKVDASFKKLFVECLRLRQMVVQNCPKWSEIVKQCISILDMYIDLYVDPNQCPCSWLVPGLAILCNFMNKAAFSADADQEDIADIAEDDDPIDDEETQNKYTKEVLNAIRPKLGKVRGDEGRHGAYVVLLGQSIKGCLQLGNMQMAAGFLKLCDSRQINFHRVPRGPMVNFRYFLGKLYMQQENFEKAESELVWAFSNCPASKVKVLRNILECLISVRLRMGILPPILLLKKYRMDHFIKILSSIKTGDISKFQKTMEENARILIKHGTILCIERVIFIVYRTLLKRTKDWWVKSGLSQKGNQVPIQVFSASLKWQSDEFFDDNEMACIMANLIKMGYIKGYISWEHMMVVFSNQDPFPSLKHTRSS